MIVSGDTKSVAIGYNIFYYKVLKISFDQLDYSIIEGSATLSSPILLQFRQNQSPFTIMLSPVTVATAEAAGVGDLINADTIAAGSRATGNAHLEFVCVHACVCACVTCLVQLTKQTS